MIGSYIFNCFLHFYPKNLDPDPLKSLDAVPKTCISRVLILKNWTARDFWRNFLACLFFSSLKGQCHEIFVFMFFHESVSPQAPEYTTTDISNFFENSRRYSRLKMHHRCQRHRWQMEKIFKKRNFNNFVWVPLGSKVNIP